MSNAFLEKQIDDMYEETQKEELRKLREAFEDKENQFRVREFVFLPLSEYSTTQLKAELRRRKKLKGGAE